MGGESAQRRRIGVAEAANEHAMRKAHALFADLANKNWN